MIERYNYKKKREKRVSIFSSYSEKAQLSRSYALTYVCINTYIHIFLCMYVCMYLCAYSYVRYMYNIAFAI